AIYLATVWALLVIIAITFHEAAHGFVGDDTAWRLGRVSFNPLNLAECDQHTDAPHALGLLRPRRERPRYRTAEQRHELTSLHCLPVHAKFGVQLRPSKQESASSETG